MGALLMQVPAPPTLDAETTAAVAALVAAAERETTARLLPLGAAGSSSGDASTAASTASNTRSVTPQPQLPVPVPQPPPPAQPPPAAPVLPVAAVEPFALDGALSLRASVERLVRSSLRRPLDGAESAQLAQALEQSLNLLQAGGAEAAANAAPRRAGAALGRVPRGHVGRGGRERHRERPGVRRAGGDRLLGDRGGAVHRGVWALKRQTTPHRSRRTGASGATAEHTAALW